MADTGAPWNIPYVAGTDLVRDWPTDSQELAEAIADGLDAAGNAGLGSNVVQTVKTDTFTATIAGAASTAITGLTVTITPTSTSSKVLVSWDVSGSSGASNGTSLILERDGTPISVGDAASSRSRVTAAFAIDGDVLGSTTQDSAAGSVLDSPGTTSAVVYSLKIFNNRGSTDTVYVNRSNADTDVAAAARTASRITAIEVAA